MLTTHYWSPIPEVVNYLVNYCQEHNYKKILEIGPGHKPFPLATHVVDVDTINVDTDKLPYQDNEFDFVYARHVLEDLNFPINLFFELQRVSKSGYVETPSPLAEITKNVDITHGETSATLYRGYIHHRFLVWNNKSTFTFLPKYPVLDHILFHPTIENKVINYLNSSPFYWNSYYMWDVDNKPKSKFICHEVDFSFVKGYEQYKDIILRALDESIISIESWRDKIYQENS